MKAINISEFRERCLTLVDELPPEGIVITRRGKPVAKVVPVLETGANLIGALKGVLEIRGDIFSTGEKWDAES